MSVETVTMELDPASAAILRDLQEKAISQGVPLDSLLRRLTEGTHALQSRNMTPEEKAEDFLQWARAHAVKGVIADDRRESLYSSEDDDL